MRTKVIVSMMLILLIIITFSGLAGAQVLESPTYLPPPSGPPPGTPPITIPPVAPPAPPGDISTPETGGGLATGATMLFGLLLVSAALPLKRR